MSSDTKFSPARLFWGSCISLIATSVAFAVMADIMGALKSHFILTNYEVGMIAGAATWGFTVSIFVIGPLVDAIGMKRTVWIAFAGHVTGVLMMIFAGGFWTLFFGALVLAMGNGTVEAFGNPLVTTIYPREKTKKLNQFHVWFPGGIVIGGLICFALTKAGIMSWQLRLGIILIPAVIYGFLFLPQKFPATERVQSGISFAEMAKATLLRPLFLLLFFAMMLTASMELGPNRWIPSILQAGGIPGILVLVWISGLMAVLRFFAGPVIKKLSPTGLLLASAVLAGIGLYGLSYSETIIPAFITATVFALGVCYFWPTMLGVTSERVPKGGAMALAFMGGIGMLIVGIITTPQMGKIADNFLPDKLPAIETRTCLQEAVDTFPALKAAAKGDQGKDIQAAIDIVNGVLEKQNQSADSILPHPETANALRSIIGLGVDSPVVGKAKAILNPAENFGGRMSFRYTAFLGILLILIFGGLYLRDRARGGYKAEKIK
ncbi:MAG: MFS transporter [Candidatus Aminicenantes bacterium]|nr:MFS transporter [Candidatus Aminicenantes bacterium]